MDILNLKLSETDKFTNYVDLCQYQYIHLEFFISIYFLLIIAI